MGNIQPNFTFNKKETLELSKISNIIAVTNTYIISRSKMANLNIFDIRKNLSKNIKFNSTDFIIKFHPNFENVFLFADENIIKIFEILPDKLELKERLRVNGHTQLIKLAEFSKTNDDIFVTYSLDKTIKVWKIDNPFCICNIPLCNIIIDIQVYDDYIFYFDETEYKIIKNDYNKFKVAQVFKVNTSKFIILNQEKLALINDFSLIIKDEKGKEKIIKFKGLLNYIFYDRKLELLYIFYQQLFEVLDMRSLNIIFSQKIEALLRNLFFSNKIQEENIYANFFMVFEKKIEFCSFYSKNNFCKKEYKNSLIAEESFWQKAVPNISDISNLEWEANISEDIIKCKDYLNMKVIKDELDSNYNKSLEVKKFEVMKVMEELKGNQLACLDYIGILKLLIKDNTNKTLIINYLNYLKNNDKKDIKLKDHEIESFDNEYNNYKILYDNEELKLNGFKEKSFSEKEKFMILLNNISNLNENNRNEFESLKSEADNFLKNLQLFNQPVNYSNKELYWFRNLFIVYFALKEILKDKAKFNSMKDSIKLILNNNLLDKDYILEKKELLTSIMILIAIPQSSNTLLFNLNLLQTKDPNYNYKDELNKIIRENEMIDKNECYLFKYKKDFHLLRFPSESCINNFFLSIDNDLNLEEFEKKNYDSLVKHFDELIDFKTMKLFLSKIFCSNVFRQAFSILYPDYFKFPFKDEKEALNFLEEYYHFIPFKTDRTAAITEKFSLEIYYILKKKNILYIRK